LLCDPFVFPRLRDLGLKLEGRNYGQENSDIIFEFVKRHEGTLEVVALDPGPPCFHPLYELCQEIKKKYGDDPDTAEDVDEDDKVLN
jgi:hypothetical protein